MEGDKIPESYLIAEVASTPEMSLDEHIWRGDGIPLTEGQEVKLALWDRQIEEWVGKMEIERTVKELKDIEFKNYMQRTHDLKDL